MSDRSGFSGKVLLIVFFLGILAGMSLCIFAAWQVGGKQMVEVFNPKRMLSSSDNGAPASTPLPNAQPDLYSVLPEGEKVTPAATAGGGPRPATAVVSVPEGPQVSTTIQSGPNRPTTLTGGASNPQIPTASNAGASPTSRETYWLQVGSFAKAEDAENRRVELAFAGFEGTVQKMDVSGVGTRYRVRLGPFTNADLLNRVKSEVERRNFETAIVQK